MALFKKEEKKKEKEKTTPMSFLYDVISVIATAVIAVSVAFLFFFRTVGVVGSSMFPTLHDGDRIVLTSTYFEAQQGDIVVTCQPVGNEKFPDTLVKRVIATEGQTVDIDFEKGIVYVDGVALDEPYIYEATNDKEDFDGPVTVPEDCVFVMGDNRNNSVDSRDNRVGFIKEEYIMGKAMFRVVPSLDFDIG